MSAVTPMADKRGYGWNVRFVPIADIAAFTAAAPPFSFIAFVRAASARGGFAQFAQRLGEIISPASVISPGTHPDSQCNTPK